MAFVRAGERALPGCKCNAAEMQCMMARGGERFGGDWEGAGVLVYNPYSINGLWTN